MTAQMRRKMKKQFEITLVMPITLTVEADDKSGEVVITSVIGVLPPSVSEINDSLDDAALDDIDDAFENAQPAS